MSHLRIFGSVARNEDRDDSDLDLLVDLADGMGLLALGRARHAVEEILGTTVDLFPSNGLKPDVAARVASEPVPL